MKGVVEWWARQDLNLRPTPNAFGAALITIRPPALFQQKQSEPRIFLSFHVPFKFPGFFQRADFQSPQQFQSVSQPTGGTGMAMTVLFQSPLQISSGTDVAVTG